MVRTAMQRNAIPFVEIPDEAAFYGPKIDVQVKSAIGKEFTLATNQVDFAQAERFDLEFTREDGGKERPLIIHRAPLSTHERLIGFLLEHYGGAFPVWLAPVQAVIIPVTDGHIEYAKKLDKELKEAGIRVKVDSRSDRMNYKIREAQLGHVPYMLVVGGKEISGGTVSVRLRNGEQKNNLPFEDFKKAAVKVIVDKAKDFGL
jgi:threonyl-tRNA synthetase